MEKLHTFGDGNDNGARRKINELICEIEELKENDHKTGSHAEALAAVNRYHIGGRLSLIHI